MSDGSDGAGGVGGGGGNVGGAGNDTSASDSIGNAAESIGSAIGDAVGSLGEAIGDALGGFADALGVDNALGGLADAFGLDAQDLQGVLGAALMGAVTGGLPGAIMGAVNAMVGGSLTEAAKDAVAKNLPESLQPIANLAIDAFASRIPGAGSTPQNALDALASGALTNGRVPGMAEFGALAQSMGDVQSVARDVMGAVTRGDFNGAADAAASAIGGALQDRMGQARGIAEAVGAAVENGRGVYAEGRHDAFGSAVERFAVETARSLMLR